MAGHDFLNRHGIHNYPPQPVQAAVHQARASITQNARDASDPPSQITRDVTAAMPSTSAVHMPNRPALGLVIARARRQADSPSEPTSMDQVQVPDNLIEVNGQKFLGRDVTFGISTEQNLRKLQEAPYWVMDGTFQTCLLIFWQIYTIHAIEVTDLNTQGCVQRGVTQGGWGGGHLFIGWGIQGGWGVCPSREKL